MLKTVNQPSKSCGSHDFTKAAASESSNASSLASRRSYLSRGIFARFPFKQTLSIAMLLSSVTIPTMATPLCSTGEDGRNTAENISREKFSGEQLVARATEKKKPKSKVEDLPNFHEVHPFLLRGGEPTDAGLKLLKAKGVDTIIDLRAANSRARHEKSVAKSLGINYINLPMDYHAPTQKQVNTLLDTIDDAKKRNGKVFVHCQHGSDRAGCMVGIYRVTRDDWSFDKTYKEMRGYYFGPKYNLLREAVHSRVGKDN